MRISSVNRNIYANKLYGIQSSRNAVLQEKLQFPDITNKHQNNNLVQLPLNTLKANFCPSLYIMCIIGAFTFKDGPRRKISFSICI